MRRLALFLVALSGCGEIDVGDLDKPTRPSTEKRCTEEAHNTPDGLYDNGIYLRCMYGHAQQVDDAGARD